MTDILHIPCPHCLKLNRLPRQRVGEQPNCGACHKPLQGGKVAELSEAAVDGFTGRSDLPVVVDFWASWCGPCKAMAPEFERAAADWQGRVMFAKVNTEQAPQASARFGIRSIPTLILFRGGREIARQSGAMAASQLDAWLTSKLG